VMSAPPVPGFHLDRMPGGRVRGDVLVAGARVSPRPDAGGPGFEVMSWSPVPGFHLESVDAVASLG
jgi:hypothetical protein